jgi:hypothetical protein
MGLQGVQLAAADTAALACSTELPALDAQNRKVVKVIPEHSKTQETVAAAK